MKELKFNLAEIITTHHFPLYCYGRAARKAVMNFLSLTHWLPSTTSARASIVALWPFLWRWLNERGKIKTGKATKQYRPPFTCFRC